MSDYDSTEWYSSMQTWSESAGAAGDAETMIIAELAMGHDVTRELRSCHLSADQRKCIDAIMQSFAPRLAACRVADHWG